MYQARGLNSNVFLYQKCYFKDLIRETIKGVIKKFKNNQKTHYSF